MNNKRVFSLVLFFALFLCLFGCGEEYPAGKTRSESGSEPGEIVSGSENEPEEEKKIVKIGVFDPQVGPYAANGRLELLGVKCANRQKPRVKAGKVKYNVELVVAGKIESRADAKKEAKRLVNEGVSAVIGGCGGAFPLSAARIFEENGIPFVCVSASPLKLTEDFGNVFTLSRSDENTGKKLASFLVNDLGKSTALVLAPLGDDSAEEIAFFFAQQLESLGGKAKIKTFDISENDFSSFADEAVSYDALFVASPFVLSTPVIEAASARGIRTILSTSMWNSEAIFQPLSNVSIDLYIASNLKYADGSEECAALTDLIDSDPELSDLRFGNAESGIVYGAFDAYNTVLSAIRSAKSVSGQKIIKKLSSFSGKGITGKISYDETGAREQPAAIFRFNTFISAWDKISSKG